MTPLFPAQHAAEEFDNVLEGRATTEVAERYSGLVATVQVLRVQPEVTPRADFVAELRSRLMLAAETDMVPAPPVVRRLPTRSRRKRRLGTAAAALVIVGGTAGMAAAASGALPGESLYPIKRGVEQVTIAAHVGDASKGSALLGQANERLDEVKALVASDASPALVDATVADFNESADAGSEKLFQAYQDDANTADITTVRDFTDSAMSELDSMAQTAGPANTASLRDAADTVADIDQQAAMLCASCGGDILTPPGTLASGSGAPAVVSLIATPVSQAGADIRAQTALSAADKAKLDDLRNAAQGTADSLGKAAGGGTAADAAPLESTLTSTGKLVPELTTKTAGTVNNLVGGLTGTVTSVTGGGGGGGDSGVETP